MREYIIYLGFPSNGGARQASSRLATLSFNVLVGIIQAKDFLLQFFRVEVSSTQVLAQNKAAQSLQMDAAPASFLSQSSSLLFVR